MGVQDQGVNRSGILAAVTNFEMSEEADQMKKSLVECFGGLCEVVLVDSSSSIPPKKADEVVPNEYYTGLWNKTVEIAIERGSEWLLFLASDVAVEDYKKMCSLTLEVSKDPRIGIYCPSVDDQSRHSFKECGFKGTGGMRDCKSIEGFCFMARTDILKAVHPVTNNKYGYCIDKLACDIARRMGYRVVVDDRSKIFHPKSESSIDKVEATQVGMAFYWTRINEFDERMKKKSQSFSHAGGIKSEVS